MCVCGDAVKAKNAEHSKHNKTCLFDANQYSQIVVSMRYLYFGRYDVDDIKRLCIKTKNLFYDDNWASGCFSE